MTRNKRSLWELFTGKVVKESPKNNLNSELPKLRCFISYNQRDGQRYSEALARLLKDYGVDVFRDMDRLRIGDNFAGLIRNELQHTDVLILVGTSGALRSRWVLTEMRFFAERNTGKLLPIVFDDSVDNLPPFLQHIQYLKEDVAALDDGPSDRALEQLLSALQLIAPSNSPSKKQVRPKSVGSLPLNEGKLILVGRGEVGKTSLVKRLVKDQFRGDESKTQGINITNWALRCDSETLRLNIWDFGGQEIMHATHQFFLTERSLYLLVLNGREGGEDFDAEYWLKHIESFGGDSPVIVVQNKISQHPFDLNYRGLQARYPQIKCFVKTDCKDAVGLESLREEIVKVVAGMPEIRMSFPADWFTVKDRLESMKEDFMGYDGFCKLCEDEGIKDDSDRDTLCWVLHCLGIALNYRDDSRLRETSVLKPEWVTQGIYKILNAKQLAERQGELHLDDLRKLLPKERYPVNKHPFLLELMRKFSLCFPFPDEPDRYLIPELLGKEEPEDTSAFPPHNCLNFEYHYGVLPEGLIPRFIVRSHPLSRNQARWRSGVVLAHEDCRAMVTAVPTDRRVIVRVLGSNSGARRRLLAIIRYDLERINSEFKDRLDVQPKVPLTNVPTFAVDYKKLVAFEKQGVAEFPEFIGTQVVTVNVRELLNGVDLAALRDTPSDVLVNPRTVFFSYSHKDETLRGELETHLKLLQRQGVISTWHDRKIIPGTEWDREIDRYLESAKIILLLISADFIASDYCWGIEVKRALEHHESSKAIVIPVLLRSCDWKGAPFGKLQGLPADMIPVTMWPNRDAAWTDVAKGIRARIEH